MRRALLALVSLALGAPAFAAAATEGGGEEFDPAHEFEQRD